MSSSLKETWERSSGSEMQAVTSAQELATFQQRQVAEATTACEVMEDEAKKLTKEVAARTTTRIAGGNSRQHPPEPFRLGEVIRHYLLYDPLRPMSKTHRLLLLFQRRNQRKEEISRKRRKAERFEFETFTLSLKSWFLEDGVSPS